MIWNVHSSINPLDKIKKAGRFQLKIRRTMLHQPKSLSEKARSMKIGRYRHFKGGEYELVAIARTADEKEEEMAIYKSLETGYTWIRPLENFLQEVDRPELGYRGPRFIYIE